MKNYTVQVFVRGEWATHIDSQAGVSLKIARDIVRHMNDDGYDRVRIVTDSGLIVE